MEHQSAVAYGNWYIGGYRGRAPSPEGLEFDFIIIHESAHEWWGNSVTAKDVADMWIHESFGAYAEAVYVERRFGYEAALRYINGKKQGVGNRSPIIGVPGVNREGSGDMYDKGQLVLNTLRSVINDDSLWFSLLRGLAMSFRHRTIDGSELFDYVRMRTGTDYGYFFDQYLKRSAIPVLEAAVVQKGERRMLRYRWVAEASGFRMPVRVTVAREKWGWITPTTEWQVMDLSGVALEEFRAETERFYIDVRHRWTYLDERLPEGREWRNR
jgi:aminopeptidase N